MILRFLLIACMLAAPVKAADVVETAQNAADMVDAARDKLKKARSAKQQLRALVEAVRAYEVALTAMQAGLRELRTATREAQDRYSERRTHAEQALVGLQAIERASAVKRVWHPGGALAAARAGMTMADLIPHLNGEAQALRAELSGLSTLTALQEATEQDLLQSREDMRQGRDDIQRAMVVAAAKKPPSAARVQQLELLAKDAVELEALADGLRSIPARDTTNEETPVVKASLTRPVRGKVLRNFKAADAAGIVRPGIIVSASPQSLVLAPTSAEVSFSGPFLDQGNVIILELSKGYLMVLGGIGQSFVSTGDLVEAETPLGLLGDAEVTDEEFLIELSNGTSAFANESLYIELRENGIAIDPSPWFLPDG